MKIIKLLIIALIFFKPEMVHAATPQISDEQAHEIVLNGTPDDVKKLIQKSKLAHVFSSIYFRVACFFN